MLYDADVTKPVLRADSTNETHPDLDECVQCCPYPSLVIIWLLLPCSYNHLYISTNTDWAMLLNFVSWLMGRYRVSYSCQCNCFWINNRSSVTVRCSLTQPPPHPPSWTTWLPFRRRYFQVHFHKWSVLYFHSNVTEVCSQGSSWQYPSQIGDKQLSEPILIRFTGAYMRHTKGDELI